jgi:hypothetical protein
MLPALMMVVVATAETCRKLAWLYKYSCAPVSADTVSTVSVIRGLARPEEMES